MKEEIKEILDNIKYLLDNKTKFILMTDKDTEALLDYITNLQEENERLEGLIELMYYKIQFNDEQQELLDSILQGEEK